MSEALIQLEADIHADLARIAHPGAAWLEPKAGPDGKPALDVLIIGAGQSGIAIGFGLLRSRVSNILLIDKAEEGKEGPWLTYARMPTLRSPKDYTGPDLDIPGLTYQSWHEARFGKASWQELGLIAREHWAEYLLWLRRTVGLPVRNACELKEIAPAANGLLAARVKRAGEVETLYARKIVLATGQEGMGGWMIPEQLVHLPASSVATVADDIDFESLRGKILEMREGFPQPTYDRCARHANFTLHESAPVEAARKTDNGVELQTPRGAITADFVICGTGIDMDFAGRGELAQCAANIATWADRYQPPEDERNERLGRFPYLADDYAFTEREPGMTPWIADIHLFAIASTMSFGPSGSSINAMTTAVPKLVHGLTRGLFRADVERHWDSLSAYDVPQAVVTRHAREMGESL